MAVLDAQDEDFAVSWTGFASSDVSVADDLEEVSITADSSFNSTSVRVHF